MLRLSDKDRQITEKNYREYARLHMEDGWADNHKLENYKSMMHLIELTDIAMDGKSCLDVGCGTGDFSAYVKRFGAARYLGIDMYEPALLKAREKYPHETFILGDFLTVDIREQFDFAFCSGGVSIKLDTDNYAFFEATIKKMWQLVTRGLVCNMLIDTDTTPDPDLFFYNKDTILSICKTISSDAKIETRINPTRAEMHVYMWH